MLFPLQHSTSSFLFTSSSQFNIFISFTFISFKLLLQQFTPNNFMFNSITNQLNTYQYPSDYKQKTQYHSSINIPEYKHSTYTKPPVTFQYNNNPITKPLTSTIEYRQTTSMSKLSQLNQQIQKSIKTSSRSSRRRIFPQPIQYYNQQRRRSIQRNKLNSHKIKYRNTVDRETFPLYQNTFGKISNPNSAQRGYVPTQPILSYQVPNVIKTYVKEPKSPLDERIFESVNKQQGNQKRKSVNSNSISQYKKLKNEMEQFKDNSSRDSDENFFLKENEQIIKSKYDRQSKESKLSRSNVQLNNEKKYGDLKQVYYETGLNNVEKKVGISNNSLPQKVVQMTQKIDKSAKIVGFIIIIVVLIMLIYQIIK